MAADRRTLFAAEVTVRLLPVDGSWLAFRRLAVRWAGASEAEVDLRRLRKSLDMLAVRGLVQIDGAVVEAGRPCLHVRRAWPGVLA